MIPIRQLDRSVGECTAALGLVLLEVTDMAQPSQELAFGIARMGGGECIPGRVEFLRELAETRGDQHVLRGEVTVEGHLVGPGCLRDRLNPHGPDAMPIEQVGRSRENPRAGRDSLAFVVAYIGYGKFHRHPLTRVLPVSTYLGVTVQYHKMLSVSSPAAASEG